MCFRLPNPYGSGSLMAVAPSTWDCWCVDSDRGWGIPGAAPFSSDRTVLPESSHGPAAAMHRVRKHSCSTTCLALACEAPDPHSPSSFCAGYADPVLRWLRFRPSAAGSDGPYESASPVAGLNVLGG